MNDIYSETESSAVLGMLMHSPTYLTSGRFPLTKKDFEPSLMQKTLFQCIEQLSSENENGITPFDACSYMEKFPKVINIFKSELADGDYIGYVNTIYNIPMSAYNEHYQEVRKRTLLRECYKRNIDISQFYDFDKSVENNNKVLANVSVNQILEYYEEQLIELKREFDLQDTEIQRHECGDDEDIYESFKESPEIGLNFSSSYLTTLWNGFNKQQVYIDSSPSGGGKSRRGISNLVHACIKEIYNTDTGEWEENLNGTHKGLYFGCELEPKREVLPIFWAVISGVESYKITKGICNEEEEKRVKKAIKLLKKNIMIADCPTFNSKIIEEEIKTNKYNKHIEYVVFDYITITNELIREIVNKRGKGIGLRTDEVLAELSADLKVMAKKYDVGIYTATQTNSSINDFRVRDATCIKGSRALAEKATGCSITMPITEQEMKLVEPYIEKRGFNHIYPTHVVTVFKSRFNQYETGIKVFMNLNLGNLKVIDMFCTDQNFKLINVDKTINDFREEKEIANEDE